MLEDYPSTNLSNKSVKTGGEYLFSAGNLEQFFTNQTYNLERVRDFKNFLDRMADMSFTNFIDLGVLPPDDSYISSLGKPYSTLNPYNAFKDLQGKLLDVLTDYSSVVSSIGSLRYLTNQDMFDRAGNNLFAELDLIGLFCSEINNVQGKYAGVNVNFGQQISNWIYNYVYSAAKGDNAVSAETVATYITNFCSSLALQHPINSGAVNLDAKILMTDYSTWKIVFADAIKNSKFLSVIIDFFKKYIDLGNSLPIFFYYIRELTKILNLVSVDGASWQEQEASESNHIAIVFNYGSLINVTGNTKDFQGNISLKSNLDVIKSKYSKKLDIVATNIDLYAKNSTLLTFGVVNTIQTLRDNVKSVLNKLEGFDQNITEYLLRYLDNDPNRLSELFKESQLQLLLSTVEDIYQSYNGFSVENADKDKLFIKREDNISHSSSVVEMMKSYFSKNEFLYEKGYNKQIISVGIPRGLFKDFNTFFKDKNSSNKSDDIFKIMIYKMDMLNPYLIYKPKPFIFEASRFPIRDYSELKKVGTDDLVPTRNYSLYSTNEKFKFGVTGHNTIDSFGSEYNGWSPNLTNKDKDDILANQTTSFILENYLKIISGFNVSELTFNDVAYDVAESKMNGLTSTTETQNPYTFNPGSNTADFNRDALSKNHALSKAAERAIPNPDAYISKLIQPKKFDRVFNIIFDPEFEIDYDATVSGLKNTNQSGIFQNYLDSGHIKQLPNTFTYVDVTKNLNDIEFNSYFVTMESHNTYDDGIKNK